MRNYNLTLAIIFIIANLIPFIFGIVFFFLIIPIPGIILYIFYWRILNQKTSLQEIRNTWIATAIYNFLLIIIFQNDLMGLGSEGFRQDDLQWTTLYQGIGCILGIVSAFVTQDYISKNQLQLEENPASEEEILTSDNRNLNI
ncbi:MAG: hypothetical protein EOP53_02265 [Sphingobacteriales bacterium]|nr:MAG: hypothetical protein EOP53_02265 [Sphingobacteriales bacterium]